MDEEQKDHQPEESSKKPYTFSDEKTKKKIKRHISDIHDVISENDIKDVKIPGSEKPVKSRRGKKDPANKMPAEDFPTKPVEDGSEGNPVTPWDVLNE